MRKLVFLISLLFLASQGYAQECGTIPTAEQLDFMQQIQSLEANRRSARTAAGLVRIPIKFHSVRPSDGSGGLTEGQANSILSKTNQYYSNAGIEFFQYGEINYINSDAFYNLNSANEGGLAVANDVSQVINLYLMNSLQSNGLPLCGYTRFPPSSDRVFSTYGCALNGTTVEHELGHYFTLFHTHGKTNTGTTDELVNGSNCSNAGDNICDTPADPNLSGRVSATCIYTGTAVDANGQSFIPDVANVMSYSRDQCTNRFSAGQYERIRSGYENGRNYLLVETPNFAANFYSSTRNTCRTGSISFTATGSGATSWSWEFPGGTPSESTAKNPTVRYDAAGVFSVRLTARAANGETVQVEKNSFITIEDPLVGARVNTLNYTIDEALPTDFKITNPDQALTFSYAAINKDGGTTSGSIHVNNYNYQADQPVNYDYLMVPYLNSAGVKKYTIEFDLSYTSRKGAVIDDFVRADTYDSLTITATTKCGSAPKQVWKKGGEELQTVPSMIDEFIPSSTADWQRISVDVPITEGEYAQLVFINSSLNGNNLFVDNLSITPDYSLATPTSFRATQVQPGNILLRWLDNSTNEISFVLNRSVNDGPFVEYSVLAKNTQQFTDTDTQNGNAYAYQLYAKGFEENTSTVVGPLVLDQLLISSVGEGLSKAALNLYPNPTTGKIVIEGESLTNKTTFGIFDLAGKMLFQQGVEVTNGQSELDISSLERGLYVVGLHFEDGSVQFIRLIKN